MAIFYYLPIRNSMSGCIKLDPCIKVAIDRLFFSCLGSAFSQQIADLERSPKKFE